LLNHASRLAARYGLVLVKKIRFEDYIEEEMEQGKDLLWRMKALEVMTQILANCL